MDSSLNTELERDLAQHEKDIQGHLREQMENMRPQFIRKSKEQTRNAREIYHSGAQFRVVREGARLEGVVTWGEKHWAGYARSLNVGEIVTCNGWREGMAGGGVMEANFTVDGAPWNALWIQVWPQASLWRPWPMDGFLEPIEQEEN